jgi:hypothetical protein
MQLCRAIFLLVFAAGVVSQVAAQSEPVWLDDAARSVLSAYDRDSVLIVGELHGNVETPNLVALLIRGRASEGAVTLALEVPRSEQMRIERFLRSDSSPDAVAALLSGEFWQAPANRSDGRRSEAMVALLESVRVTGTEGSPVEVVTLDGDFSGADRREGMAARIGELAGNLERGPVVVLIGNYHAAVALTTRRVFSNGEEIEPPVPTASLVRDVPLTSINVAACRGSTWACAAACGPIELSLQCDDPEAVELTAQDAGRYGYHFSLVLPELTPSPPAR